MCQRLNTGDSVVTKQKPSLMKHPWHYLAFGEGYFYWMPAITFNILARAAEQSLVSVYRPGVGVLLVVLVCLTSLDLGPWLALYPYQW